MHRTYDSSGGVAVPARDLDARGYGPPDAPEPSDAPRPAPRVNDGAMPSRWWPLRALAALVVATLSFFPVSNWIPGGYGDAEFGILRDEWIAGSFVVLGVGLVLAMLSRRIPALWRQGLASRLGDALWRRWWAYGATLALATFVLSAVTASALFARRPSIIDEIVQLAQARVYAAGHLATPVPAHQEFFTTLHTVTRDGKVFSQFPPGGPAMIALGVLLGAPWLLNPIVAAAGVLLWAWCLRRAEPNRRVAALALALFALSPFAVFMSGSYMNHVTTMTWLNLACAALAALWASSARAEGSDAEPPTALAPARPGLGFLVGLGLGVAATIRPVDALAFALPAGLWMLIRALREPRRWAEALPAGVGVALPILAMMWVHVNTTGKPLLFGYELLWGKEHGLGFHMAPWGIPHTPARGIEMLSLYGTYLQQCLFETSLPGLIPFIAALALVPRLRPYDRFLLASGLLVTLAYFAYWHNGFFLGPRFLYPLIPLLTWWTARALPAARARFAAFTPDSLGYRFAVWSMLAAVVMALAVNVPTRLSLYAKRNKTERWDVEGELRKAGARNAIVLVPETWESQFAVRMRALGITAQAAEKTYRAVDACRLEHALLDLEARRVTGAAATAELFALLPDSVNLDRVELPSQVKIRVHQGSGWSRRCMAILAENGRGALGLAPFMHTPVPGVLFARDLHERDAALFAEYPGRDVWVLRPSDGTLSGTPTLHRAPMDSLRKAWEAMR